MLGVPKPKVCALDGCDEIVKQYRTTDKYCSPRHAMMGGTNKAIKRAAYKKAVTHREPAKRTRMKDLAKKRDNYQCMLVGVDGHTCDFRREAHHVIYLSEGVADELWNLICLCGFAHHQIVHKDKNRWQLQLLQLIGGKNWYEKIDQTGLPEAVVKKLDYLHRIELETDDL